MLRSVTVSPCELYLQPVIAYETMSKLGEMDLVHFVKTPSEEGEPHTRSFTIDIQRCVELEKRLAYFEYEMLREKVHIAYPEKEPKPIHPSEMVMFENMVEKWEADIIENSESLIELKEDVVELKEIRAILNDVGPLLDKSQGEMDEIISKFHEDGEDTLYHGEIHIMTGVIDRDKSLQCQTMLWRISRGNIRFIRADHDLVTEHPETGSETRKIAFMACCQGDALRNRMEKICAAFKANIHPCPRDKEKRLDLLDKINSRIEELESVLARSQYYRCIALRSIGKQWRIWLIQVRKTKAIYEKLNLMKLDLPKNSIIARCWIAEKDIEEVQKAMDSCTETVGVRVPSVVTRVKTSDALPPTLQYTNKFTHGSQVLINAYGDARYKEINPAVFAIIGIPFLFCVMFGDMGHALIIIVIALWMIVQEDELKKRRGNEVWDIFFGGRYILLLMGIWSMYSGFVFNQVFTKSLNLSPNNSMWRNTLTENTLATSSGKIKLSPQSRQSKQYVYGTDPMWQMATNRVALKNSQMIKLSIIIGTLHIMFGIIISAFNHLYFRNGYAVCLQFVPQFLFVFLLFGWLVILIYYKWWFYYAGNSDIQKSELCAPPILTHFLARFIPMLFVVYVECKSHLFFEYQTITEIIFNVIIILCVIVLLFGTPVYIYLFNYLTKKNLQKEIKVYRIRHMRGCRLSCSNPSGDLCGDACRKQEEKWQEIIDRHSTPFTFLLTNQFIYTIDFVLGTISHVASYLRLWALGMGHWLIAESLWTMVLRRSIRKFYNPTASLQLVFSFAIFAILTFIVLIFMEGLCCFLHSLRLHWVEFMSKFYIDEGSPFIPFTFKNIDAEMYTKSTEKRFDKCKRELPKKGKFYECLQSEKEGK